MKLNEMLIFKCIIIKIVNLILSYSKNNNNNNLNFYTVFYIFFV